MTSQTVRRAVARPRNLSHDNPWAPYLAPGDTILWEGTPEPGFHVTGARIAQSVFGAVFLAVAIFITSQIFSAGGFFWMASVPFILAGLYLSIGNWFWERAKLASTIYAYSERNCFIASRFGARTIRSYPIARTTEIILQDDAIPSVLFAKQTHRIKQRESVDVGFSRIGFVRIREGREIYRHLLQLQKELA